MAALGSHLSVKFPCDFNRLKSAETRSPQYGLRFVHKGKGDLSIYSVLESASSPHRKLAWPHVPIL